MEGDIARTHKVHGPTHRNERGPFSARDTYALVPQKEIVAKGEEEERYGRDKLADGILKVPRK